VFLPVAVLIGVIIRASVPTWYRAALGRRQANLIAAASADRADDGLASVPSQPVPPNDLRPPGWLNHPAARLACQAGSC
jgi:hypothetical protein